MDAPIAELTSGGRTLDEVFIRETARDAAPEAFDAAAEGAES